MQGTSQGSIKGWETRRNNLKVGDRAIEARRYSPFDVDDCTILKPEHRRSVTIVDGKTDIGVKDKASGAFIKVPHYRVKYEDGVTGWVRPDALEEAQDSGTHEGAVKAAQTRKAHGWGNGGVSPTAGKNAQSSTSQITEHTHTPAQLKAAISKAPMIGGKGSAEGGARRSSLSAHGLGNVLHRNGGTLPVGTRFVDESGNVGAYMGQRKMSNGLVSHTVKMANGTVHTGIPLQMPNLYLAREVGKYL